MAINPLVVGSPPVSPPQPCHQAAEQLPIARISETGKRRFEELAPATESFPRSFQISKEPRLQKAPFTAEELNRELDAVVRARGREGLAMRLLTLRQQVGEDHYLHWLRQVSVPAFSEACAHLLEITVYLNGMSVHETKCQLYYLFPIFSAENQSHRKRFEWLIANLLHQHDVAAFEEMVRFEVNLVEDLHLLCEEALRNCSLEQFFSMFAPTSYSYLTKRLKNNLVRRLMVDHHHLTERPNWLQVLENIANFFLCVRQGILEKGEATVVQEWLAALPAEVPDSLSLLKNFINFHDFPLFWKHLKPLFCKDFNRQSYRFLMHVILEWPELDLRLSPVNAGASQLYKNPEKAVLAYYLPKQFSPPKVPHEVISGVMRVQSLAYKERVLLLYLNQQDYHARLEEVLTWVLKEDRSLYPEEQLNLYRLILKVIRGTSLSGTILDEKIQVQFNALVSSSLNSLQHAATWNNRLRFNKRLCFKWMVDLSGVAEVSPALFSKVSIDLTHLLIAAIGAANTVERKQALLVSVAALASVNSLFFKELSLSSLLWVNLLNLVKLPFPAPLAGAAFKAADKLHEIYKKEIDAAFKQNITSLLQIRAYQGRSGLA